MSDRFDVIYKKHRRGEILQFSISVVFFIIMAIFPFLFIKKIITLWELFVIPPLTLYLIIWVNRKELDKIRKIKVPPKMPKGYEIYEEVQREENRKLLKKDSGRKMPQEMIDFSEDKE